jgi:orotidine-5'-phosphate decarboxylase
MIDIRKRIFVALDYPTAEEALSFAKSISGTVKSVKVGMQLYYAAGPQIVAQLKDLGFYVFVDLKIHDIPNTAKGAMQSLASLGADMVNVHIAGGKEMMLAARAGLEKGAANTESIPLLIGVTQLTSTSQQMMNNEIQIPGTVADCVRNYAQLAKEAGLDGVVASPLEVPMIKEVCGSAFLTVTPGIRPQGGAVGDQKRVTTPDEAFQLGSDYIVIGRPITQAANPAQAMEQIVRSVSK